MLVFPNAKINLGLHIISKRNDGFHNLETCFYPVKYTDALEISQSSQFQFSLSGLIIPGIVKTNLCLKAYQLLNKDHDLPPVHIHLHKVILVGSGLGGGSTDAAFTIKIINDLFTLNLSFEKMASYASQLGSDCAFFINNKPVIAIEKGDVFEEINIDLYGYDCVLVCPDISISTPEAYRMVIPKKHDDTIKKIITTHISKWRNVLKNDFEDHIFAKYPQLAKIKSKLYKHGAIYASMTGSGSCIYGIFDSETDTDKLDFRDCNVKRVSL